MYDWHRLRERVAIDLLRWSPKATFSRGVGWAAKRPVPRRLRNVVYSRFARQFGIDLGEVDRPLEEFGSVDEFFTRPLPPGARPIAAGDDVVVSPADGVLSESGVSEGGRLIQCKGLDYTVRGILADENEAKSFVGGAYATIYLAPHNYHRVHAPTGGVITGFRHIPGAFFPVNQMSVRHVAGLFSINERLVTYLDGPLGRVAVVMVAAIGVSHITVAYDTVEAGASGKRAPRAGRDERYLPPRPTAKGAELGTFHLGSTVVLLFQPGRVQLSGLERGQTVRVGMPLGFGAAGRSGEVAA